MRRFNTASTHTHHLIWLAPCRNTNRHSSTKCGNSDGSSQRQFCKRYWHVHQQVISILLEYLIRGNSDFYQQIPWRSTAQSSFTFPFKTNLLTIFNTCRYTYFKRTSPGNNSSTTAFGAGVIDNSASTTAGTTGLCELKRALRRTTITRTIAVWARTGGSSRACTGTVSGRACGLRGNADGDSGTLGGVPEANSDGGTNIGTAGRLLGCFLSASTTTALIEKST